MKVKILRDFKYSLNGIRPVEFKEGDFTEKFSDKVVEKLMKRGWLGVKASKTQSEQKPTAKEIKAAEKANKEKLAKKRGAELIKAGATLIDGHYCWLKDKAREDELLEATDEDWAKFIFGVTKAIKVDANQSGSDKPAENSGDAGKDKKSGGGVEDDSFDDDDLGNESEKSGESGKNDKK